jgi:hypothetical protein
MEPGASSAQRIVNLDHEAPPAQRTVDRGKLHDWIKARLSNREQQTGRIWFTQRTSRLIRHCNCFDQRRASEAFMSSRMVGSESSGQVGKPWSAKSAATADRRKGLQDFDVLPNR